MKHFACSDLHGKSSIYEKLINEYCKSEDSVLYYLGDACDRGSEGYSIMKDLLSRKNIVYLKGNHEDMFVRAARELLEIAERKHLTIRDCIDIMGLDNFLHSSSDAELSILNGGYSTLKAWLLDGGDVNFINQIDSLPLFISFASYDLCHAGCSKKTWSRIKQMETSNKDITDEDREILLWDRHHFYETWFDGRRLIHGHTPIQTIQFIDNEDEIIPLIRNNKINMDTGVYLSNIYFIYDMDEHKYIKIQ